MVTVASGGDDGQLTVSTVRVQYPEDGKTGGSRGFSPISESLTPLQTRVQQPDGLRLHLHSQSHIPLAHASPLTALKFLRPGLLVSTSADQRVCLYRVCSASISQIGALCSHVADAAGLAVWEGQMMEQEEEDTKGKTRFEPEQAEIAIRREEGSQTGLETNKTAENETGVRLLKDMQRADDADCGEPDESLCETGDPVRKSSRKECEADETAGVNETGGEGNRESNQRREKMGWVLVCGQGFQLLRVRHTD